MTDTKAAADYRDYLHRYGLKNTRHRQLILQLLLASEGVLTAEDIYQQLCEQGAEINFSTVYRILENFTQKGLTERVFWRMRASTALCCMRWGTVTVLSACAAIGLWR